MSRHGLNDIWTLRYWSENANMLSLQPADLHVAKKRYFDELWMPLANPWS
jgi:hypothetical protein